MNKIPPKYYGHSIHAIDPMSLRQQLSRIEIGDYLTLPLQKRSQIGWIGRALSKKFVTRQMGELDTFRCYRVE